LPDLDVLYTLPLAADVFAALCFGAVQHGLWHWNLAGLALSSLYLAWSTGAKLEADHRVRDILAQGGALRAPADPAHARQDGASANPGRERRARTVFLTPGNHRADMF